MTVQEQWLITEATLDDAARVARQLRVESLRVSTASGSAAIVAGARRLVGAA